MNKEKVFKCPICLKQYTHSYETQMTHKYCDVICQNCIHNISKPLKNAISSKNKLLSKQTQSEKFYCKAHPDSLIEFYCEIDNCAMCSQCNSTHEIFNHQVNKINPKKSNFEKELEGLTKSIEEDSICIKKDSFLLNQLKNNINNFLNEQLNQLNSSAEQFILSILKQKMMIQKDLKTQYNNQLKEIDILMIDTTRMNEDFEKLTELCKEYRKKFTQEKIIFDDIDNFRKTIIKDWEHLRLDVHNNKISHANIYQEKKRNATLAVIEQLGEIFKLTDRHILSFNANVQSENILHTKINNKNIHRSNNRSESLGSAKLSSQSTKEESNKKQINNLLFKPKRFSHPNIQPSNAIYLLKSHSQKLIV